MGDNDNRTDFHVGIVGAWLNGNGAARSCLRAGLSTWGPILTRKRARIFLLKGLVGLPPAPGEFAGVVDALVILVVNAAGSDRCYSVRMASPI